MSTALEPRLTELMTAFRTNEEVERVLRRELRPAEMRRLAEIRRLADDVHAERVSLAQELRAFLHEAL
jgi:hypothetical protein